MRMAASTMKPCIFSSLAHGSPSQVILADLTCPALQLETTE
jgi:hypothetical protein|eukprot:COSAG01_NODE_3542_length_5957_cov_14.346876_6_plen_41_part_00